MKITAVNGYKSSYYINHNSNHNHSGVTFGFGEDYGINPFVDPEFDDDVPKPSTLNALKYLAKWAFAAGSELLGSDKARLREIERLGWEYEAKEKREEEERLKNQRAASADDDDDYDY